jgi:hypothetical protein
MSKSSTLTRRAVVASTAAMPAAAALDLPAAALADPAADAKLLRLGADLDRIEQDYIAQQAIDAKENTAWEAACEAAGMSHMDFEDFPSRDEFLAYHDKRWSLHTEEFMREQEHEKLGLPSAWEEIQNPLFPLVEEILTLRASTPAGLAVQAKAVAYAAADLWDGNSENPHERWFIEAVCAFCNIKPAPIAAALASVS